MEFKGTKGKWNIERHQHQLCGDYLIIDENDYQLAIADNEYIQDYEKTKANALLISKAPEMLEELNDTIDDLKILKSNILDTSKTNNRWEGMPDVIQNWIDRKEELIKSATSFKV